MPVHTTLQQRIVSLFDQHPCWMIDPLATELGYSVCSTRRFLTDAEYYSSFTHNGKWYTLSSIPRFGRDGLWFFEDIAVFVLAEFIRQPGLSFEQLAKAVRRRCRIAIWATQIEALFALHDLKKNSSDCSAQALKALRHWQEQTVREISPAKLFPTPPVVRFGPEQELCPCGGLPVVQKTRRKTMLSTTGPFIAHETLTQCPDCHSTTGRVSLS